MDKHKYDELMGVAKRAKAAVRRGHLADDDEFLDAFSPSTVIALLRRLIFVEDALEAATKVAAERKQYHAKLRDDAERFRDWDAFAAETTATDALAEIERAVCMLYEVAVAEPAGVA